MVNSMWLHLNALLQATLRYSFLKTQDLQKQQILYILKFYWRDSGFLMYVLIYISIQLTYFIHLSLHLGLYISP